MVIENLINNKYDEWAVKSFSHMTKTGHSYWCCECSCGVQKVIRGSHLKDGTTKSCGHLRRVPQDRKRLYKTFDNMHSRCYNPNSTGYCYYGGKGVTICQEWLEDINNFYSWSIANGYTDKLTIDRIDVNGNYEPSNCRWATWAEQANNTTTNHKVIYEGEEYTLSQLAMHCGISYTMLVKRIWRGYSVEEAVVNISHRGKRDYTTDGEDIVIE